MKFWGTPLLQEDAALIEALLTIFDHLGAVLLKVSSHVAGQLGQRVNHIVSEAVSRR